MNPLNLFSKPTNSEVQTMENQALTVPFSNESNVVKINLREAGFEKAGLSRGNTNVLLNYLNDILYGFFIDQSENEEAQQKSREQKLQEIADLESQINKLEAEHKTIEKVTINELKEKIKAKEREIDELKIKAMKKGTDTISRFNLGLYWPVFIAATIFLFGFYTSAFHSAFFKNIQDDLLNADAGSLSSVLNTVFNTAAFTEFNLHWFAPVIFFVFALVLHIVYDGEGRFKNFYLGIVLLLILVADCLLAYFIESNSHTVYQLNGMADEDWAFYKSPRFYLVLFLGFFTCLGWSMILHGIKTEYSKSDIEKQTEILTNRINLEIEALKTEIAGHQQRIFAVESEIKTINQQITNKKERLNTIVYTMRALEKRISAFCDGWLTYVSHLDKEIQNETQGVIDLFYAEKINYRLEAETANAA
jgi:peptidoglycan hydrolase CwlO-like protein